MKQKQSKWKLLLWKTMALNKVETIMMKDRIDCRILIRKYWIEKLIVWKICLLKIKIKILMRLVNIMQTLYRTLKRKKENTKKVSKWVLMMKKERIIHKQKEIVKNHSQSNIRQIALPILSALSISPGFKYIIFLVAS